MTMAQSPLRSASRLWSILVVLLCILYPAFASDAQQSSPSPVRKSGELFSAAYTAFQHQTYPETIRLFHQFLTTSPDHRLEDYALFYSAAAQMELHNYDSARTLLTRLQQKHPHSILLAEARFLEADTWYTQHQYTAAITRYRGLLTQKAYKRHRLMSGLHFKLGDSYEQTDDPAAALKLYHQAWQSFPTRPVYSKAREAEDRLLSQDPDLLSHFSTQELLESVEKLLKIGKARDAEVWLPRLASRTLSAKQRETVALQQAYALYVLRDNAQALRQYTQFLTDFPHSKSIPFALDRIGRLYLREADLAAFLTIHDRLRREYPHSWYTAAAIRLKGKEFELQQRFAEALDTFTIFRKGFPSHSQLPDVLWHTGWCQYQLKQYQAALTTFTRLAKAYPKAVQHDEAVYWAGRAAEQLERVSKAATLYDQLLVTKPHSYFGMLSRQARERLLKQHPDLPPQPSRAANVTIDPARALTFASQYGQQHHQKAQELEQLGFYQLAAEELASAIAKEHKASPAHHYALARLYHRAGDAHALVRLMQKRFWAGLVLGGPDLPATFWKYAYPLNVPRLAALYATVNDLDPLFVQAIMLAESAFAPRALSAAGAMGLMQLMPSTGSKFAKQLKLPELSIPQYFQPEINLLLGTTYLKDLSALFNKEPAPIIASYNAGEHRVRTWWDEAYREDEPAFIAIIPYQETKNYVQKVLWYYREYQRIYPHAP